MIPGGQPARMENEVECGDAAALPGEVLRLLGELVAFPTVSSESNLEISVHIAEYLERHGARVMLQADETGTKANVFASFGPEAPGGLAFSGHTDVVPVEGQDWQHPPFALTEVGDRLYGRGTCDMKGFVAAAMSLGPRLAAARLAAPVHLAFTHDEEVGCHGAQRLVAELARRGICPQMVIVGEPTLGRVMDAHKGCYEYRTHFTGFEGHGSDPARGVNAVEWAARFVARLVALREEMAQRAPHGSPFEPAGTTINVGRIGGGIAQNIIAGEAEVDWEFRPASAADLDHVRAEVAGFVAEALARMRAVHPGASIETEVLGEVAGLEKRAANPARDLALACTGENAAGAVSFGTEAGLFQQLGASVVVCGPGSIAQAHKPDEFVTRAELARCLSTLERMIARQILS